MRSQSIGIDLRYRPIRFGFCIREGNIEDYRKALQLTHTLWGGRFNPLIPIGDTEKAVRLAKAFRVDALYPVFDSPLSPVSEELEEVYDFCSI